jgi:hypothetical protein
MDQSSLGRWVTDFRFEFDPPLALPAGSVPPAITAFDLTPIADGAPGLRDRREELLLDFLWNEALDI